MKEFGIKINEQQASLLQRMIVEEIEKQKQWMKDEQESGFGFLSKMRKNYIQQLEKLSDEIERNGLRNMSKYKIIIHGKNYCHIYTYSWHQEDVYKSDVKYYSDNKNYKRLYSDEKNTHEFIESCVFDSNGMVI